MSTNEKLPLFTLQGLESFPDAPNHKYEYSTKQQPTRWKMENGKWKMENGKCILRGALTVVPYI